MYLSPHGDMLSLIQTEALKVVFTLGIDLPCILTKGIFSYVNKSNSTQAVSSINTLGVITWGLSNCV